MINLSTKKHLLSLLSLFFISALSFVFLYAPTLIGAGGTILEHIGIFLSEFINSGVPVVSAAILTAISYGSRFSKKILLALPFALAKIGYLLPYGFMIFSAQYEVYFATVISVIYSLVFMLLALIEIIVYTSIICAFINRGFKNQKIAPTSRASALNLDAPVTIGVMVSALSRFAVNFILELIDTVNYFVEYAGTYTLGEIIYIIFSYVMLLIFAMATHFIACAVKNKICSD